MLKLLAAILVLVGRAQNGHDLLFRRQGNGARNLRARPLRGFHDPLGGLIDQVVLVSLQLDTDFLVGHFRSSLIRLKYTGPGVSIGRL